MLLLSDICHGPIDGEAVAWNLRNHQDKPWSKGSRGRHWKAHEHLLERKIYKR